MIRVLAVESARTYFDTNVSDHHHFFVEGRNEVLDIPLNNISIGNLPEPPEGMEIAHVDVVIRLRPKRAEPARLTHSSTSHHIVRMPARPGLVDREASSRIAARRRERGRPTATPSGEADDQRRRQASLRP